MKNKLTLAFLLFLSLQLFSQHSIIKVTDTLATYPDSKGFFYTLPKNNIIVEVKITKTNRHKGPFSEYAEKLLGLNAIQENNTIYTLKAINVSLGYQPDLSEVYFVSYPQKIKNPDSYQCIKNALAFNNKSFQNMETCSPLQINFPAQNKEEKAQFEMYDNYSMYEKIDTTYEHTLLDSAYVSIPKIYKQMVVKTTEEKANEALEEIKKIREAQWILLTGEQELDFSNLEFMIHSLKDKEQEYLSLFSGFTTTEEIDFVFYVEIPEKIDTVSIPLFTFTPTQGFQKDIQKDGDIYSLALINTHYTTQMETVLEKINTQSKKPIETSFYYRIPEYYQTYFMVNDTLLKHIGTLPINQFGIIDALPSNISSFEIDPKTGNVSNVTFQ